MVYVRKTKKLIIDQQGRECSTCHAYKTWNEFRKDKSKNNGHESACRDCNLSKYNPELNSIKGREYRQRNIEAEIERGKRYRQTEQGKEAIYRKNMSRRSKKSNVRFTPHERKSILERDNYICQCCGINVHNEKVNNPTKAHIDHIIPLDAGGNSEPDNLQVLCRTCNTTKGSKVISNENLLEFLLQTC